MHPVWGWTPTFFLSLGGALGGQRFEYKEADTAGNLSDTAATKLGGQIMGKPNELGQVKDGYLADLILVDGDPVSNIRVLQDKNRILAIMKDGKFHKAPRMNEQRRRLTA